MKDEHTRVNKKAAKIKLLACNCTAIGGSMYLYMCRYICRKIYLFIYLMKEKKQALYSLQPLF